MSSILVIEDEAPRLRLMAWFLIEAGHEIASVASADEALERVQTYKPDLIIFNTVMDDDEKQDCIRQLRERAPESRILDISEEKTRLAQGMIGVAVEGSIHPDGLLPRTEDRSASADAYLRVPFNADALLETVQTLLDVN